MICIETRHLSKQFGAQQVVGDVTFTLQSNTATALIGPNGAGKTTTLSMLVGLLQPTAGEIVMPGVKDLRTAIGFLPQYPKYFSWMTALEYTEMVAQLSGVPKREARLRAQKMLEFTGLGEALHKKIAIFSGGMKQRLGISQAIVHAPKLLLLDEPVSALDPVGRREIMNLLKEIQQTTTILYSTHILNDAEQMTDQLLFLQKGQLVEQGTLQQVRAKYEVPRFEIVFATEQQALQFASQSALHAQALGNRVLVPIAAGLPTMQQLLERLTAGRFDVVKVAQETTSLEEIFMKVVGQHEAV